MSNVVDLSQYREQRDDERRLREASAQGTLSGGARCLACRHVWIAVAPIGTGALECPSCGTLRGIWDTFIRRNRPVWACIACEGDLFRIYADETLCASCGYVGVYSDSCSPAPPMVVGSPIGEPDIRFEPLFPDNGDSEA